MTKLSLSTRPLRVPCRSRLLVLPFVLSRLEVVAVLLIGESEQVVIERISKRRVWEWYILIN